MLIISTENGVLEIKRRKSGSRTEAKVELPLVTLRNGLFHFRVFPIRRRRNADLLPEEP